MAWIIPLQDRREARRRQEQRQLTERCIEIFEDNLRRELDGFAAAPEADRAHHARRIRQLGELLEYAVRRL